MNYLADANVLAALVIPQHECHVRARKFFARRAFAITPLTQLSTLQILSRPRRVAGQILPPLHSPAEALRLVRLISNRPGVQFLKADLNCVSAVKFERVSGHRQWNDFYLAGLAEKNGLKLATFDEAIVAIFPKISRLIP